MTIEMQTKSGSTELNKNEGRDLHNIQKRSALTGRQYKELFTRQASKVKTSDHLLGRKDKLFQGDDFFAKASNSSECGQVIAETPHFCEGQSSRRGVCKWKQQSCLNDETQSFHDDHHAHSGGSLQGIQIDDDEQKCVTCGSGGQLLCCAGQGCCRSFHLSCIEPPFTYVSPGVWHCIWCIKRKIDMDVYAVSQGIESVLDDMVEVPDDEGKQKQKKYLVKYKGLAHIHNRWVSGKTLARECPSLLSRYKQKQKKVTWKKEWSVPQRLLARRFLAFPEPFDRTSDKNIDCHHEWLVKWKGLDYDQATWELESASFLRTPEALKLINDFEILHKTSHFEEDKRRKMAFSELSELPFGCQEHLIYVNKLRGSMRRDQNALVIDDQERVVRTVLFLLSLLDDTKGPFLIVTTSNALALWEAELLRWGPCANVVVYKGSRNVRSIIRTFEFYNETGDIMFQILISCCADFAEDIEILKTMNWEMVIFDECQRPRMLVHFDQIKLLAANMRLLLVSSQIKDSSFSYHSVLRLLDPEYDAADQDTVHANPSSNACEVKERLVHFIVYECQSESSKFMEFWVPALLTDVQTEQYCASLFSKSTLLRSSLKCDSTDSLPDLLVSTRKCCDHPYLVDCSLRDVVLKGIPVPDHLDVEIQLSGKLQLLNKILSEIERRELRVVIFFQSLAGSGTISIGDILDDFIHQKFGKDTYIRIDGNISRAKKQAACDLFNSKDSRKFVCLIEARACVPSTKLSSIDTIVIFNSDWDPLNDIKALQKISIGSKFEQINIFRLYSSCTVEEKVLILAKEGVILDSNIKNTKSSICHRLLTWGASCLFRKLDESTEFNVSSSCTIDIPKQTLLEDVFQELLHLLPHSSGNCDPTNFLCGKLNSVYVFKVEQKKGIYHGTFSLHGEMIVQAMDNFSIVRRLIDTEPPHIFWTNLLEWKQPRWKYMSSPLPRIKRKVKYLSDFLDGAKYEEAARKKTRTEANLKPEFVTKRGQNSASKRYKCANNVVNHVPPIICSPKPTGAARDYARNVQQHYEAINLSILATSTKYPGGQPESPSNSCLLPDRLPFLSNSTSIRDSAVASCISISGGIQNGHANSSEGYACQGQASLDTCMQGLACLSIQNLAQGTQPSVSSTDGSEPLLPTLGHYSSNHSIEISSGTSQSTGLASLQKLLDTMEESKERAVKFHNDLILRYESEHQKEIEEVNKKYDMLIHNAETAMAKAKTYLQSCYDIVQKHRGLAEVALQLQKNDEISVARPQEKWEGPSQEAKIHTVDNISAVQTIVTRDPASPEQDLMGLHAANPPAVASVLVMRQSSEVPKSSAKTSVEDDQSSADLGIIGSFRTPPQANHASHQRLSSIPIVRIPGIIHSGRLLRAPAPHLRHTRPPPSVSALGPDPPTSAQG